MSERRTSSRSRRHVNYAAEGGEINMEDDDDEDFAVSSRGPTSKKLRTTTKATEKLKPSGATLDAITSGVKERHAVGDRLFERHLETAMSLSKNSLCSSNGSQIKPQPTLSLRVTACDGGSVVLGTKEANSEIVAKNDQLESDICKVTKQVNIDGNSVEDKKKDNSRSHDSDENNDPDYSNRDSVDSELSDEEDISDEDDGDSSFDSVEKQHPKGRTLAKKNAVPVTAKSTKPVKQTSQMPQQLKKAESKPSNSAKVVLKTSAKSKANVAPSKVNCTDKRISYGSPTSGVLRLGLSRNARVKSLHQHVTNSIT